MSYAFGLLKPDCEKRRAMTNGEFYSQIKRVATQTGVDTERLCFLAHYVNDLAVMELERRQELEKLGVIGKELSEDEKIYRKFAF